MCVKKNAFITPDFFSVAPELVGLPLATPARRAMAMAVDGILVGILVQSGGVFLGLAGAFILLFASRRNVKGGFIKKGVRLALRAFAAVLLFLVVLKAWNVGEEKIHEVEQPRREATSESESSPDPDGNLSLNFPPGEALGVAAAVAGLATADEPEAVRAYSEKILSASKRAGATPSQLRAARPEMIKLLDDEADDENIAALDSVINAVAGAGVVAAVRCDQSGH